MSRHSTANHWAVGALAALFLILGGRAAVADDARPAGAKQRIVSLAPSVTEMLFALGAGDRIVGATDHCDFPAEAKKIPRVGGLGQPNVEKLLALAPDLVIATDLERKDLADGLRRAGIRVLELQIGNFAELFDAERKIGEAIGEPARAARHVQEMQAQLDKVSQRYANIPRERLPRVFIEVWRDPLLTAGGTSFLDEVIAKAGGVNVAHDLRKDYPTINPEKVVEWNPDVILLCYMADTKDAAARIGERIGWADIKAVRERRIIADISPDDLLRPGPRLIQGVRLLAERLHPTQTGHQAEK